MCGSELEFFLFPRFHEEAQAKAYAGLQPHSAVNEDYHILQTLATNTSSVRSATAMDAAGCRWSFSKVKRAGAARDQPPVRRRARDGRSHVVYKNGAKEIAGLNGRPSPSWRSTRWTKAIVVPHPLECPGRHRQAPADCWSEDAPDHFSDVFRGWLGGLLAHSRELAWLFADDHRWRTQRDSWVHRACEQPGQLAAVREQPPSQPSEHVRSGRRVLAPHHGRLRWVPDTRVMWHDDPPSSIEYFAMKVRAGRETGDLLRRSCRRRGDRHLERVGDRRLISCWPGSASPWRTPRHPAASIALRI